MGFATPGVGDGRGALAGADHVIHARAFPPQDLA